MAEITNEQKISLALAGKTQGGKPASLDGGTAAFAVSDPALAEVVATGDTTCDVKGVAAGTVSVTATYTRGDLTLTAPPLDIVVSAGSLASVEMVPGAVTDA